MTLLKVHALDVGYQIVGAGVFSRPRNLPIVHDVSFALEKSRTLGLVGGKRLRQIHPWPGAVASDQADGRLGAVEGRGYGSYASRDAAPPPV